MSSLKTNSYNISTLNLSINQSEWRYGNYPIRDLRAFTQNLRGSSLLV